MVLLSDGETTVGRPTDEGGQNAADAGVPVFTIAFGTPDGSIVEPDSGQTIPVPVQPGPLQEVAEPRAARPTRRRRAPSWQDAYERIRESLGETLGEEIEVITEQTWRWAAVALVLLSIAWALGLWWLRGMV